MIDERQEELASLYALDLLEGAESAQFEAALDQDPKLQALVRELRDAAAALTYTVQATLPPPALRNRVLSAIDTAASSREPAPDTIVRPPASLFRAYLPWLAAACFALGAGWLAALYSLSRTEFSLTRTQENLAALALKSAGNQLEAERIVASHQLTELNNQLADTSGKLTAAQQTQAEADRLRLLAQSDSMALREQLAGVRAQLADGSQRLAAATSEVATLTHQLKSQGDLANFKITTLASMLNNSPQALAVAVWDPAKQEGVLQVEKLPSLAADKEYQLWVVDPQYPIPVDGGVFTVNPAGAARVTFKSKQPVNVINAFAVTLERKGGVPKAEGPFVLLGK